MHATDRWLEDWVWGEPLPPPAAWGRPGLLLLFNLECAGCVGRAVPWLKRLAAERGAALTIGLVHTAYGHRVHPRDGVVPQLTRFAAEFARLTTPIALDLDGSWAEANGAEGTPHWLAYGADGRQVRSLYGSQENALTRLSYLVDELVAG